MFKKILAATAAGALLISTTGCSVVGVRTTPEPNYEVLKTDGDIEVRRYASMVVASTTVEGDFESTSNKGFRPLFNYITGENKTQAEISMTAPVITQNESEEIAMTAPVLTREQDGKWEYQFVLPETFTLETAPTPNNPDVVIKQTEPKVMAVIQYSGLLREKSKNKNIEELTNWIQNNGYESIAKPMIAGYDPPWTIPFLRRNEVLMEVNTP